MVADQFARFPDFNWLGAVSTSGVTNCALSFRIGMAIMILQQTSARASEPTFGWQSASDLVPTTKSSACGADNFCEAKAKEWRAALWALVNFEIERSTL